MDSKNDIFATPEGKRDFVIALVVIAIFAVFIYQFLFKSTEEVTSDAAADLETLQVETAASTEEEQHYLYTNSETYRAARIQVENGYEPNTVTAVVISDLKEDTPLTADTKNTNTNETVPFSETLEQTQDSLARVQNEAASAATNQLEKETVAKTSQVETTVVSKTDTETSKRAFNCVVIVGVFKDLNNKTTVIEKLKSLGYEHSEGILREDLSYVGVPVACDNEQERNKLLNELNQAFGIDSWVMRLKLQW